MLYFSGIKASLSLPDSDGGCNIMESNIVGKLELPLFFQGGKTSHEGEVNNF